MFQKTKVRLSILIATAVLVVTLFLSVFSRILVSTAGAAPSTNLNFQARLLSSSGSVVADGYYNIEFKLYNVSTAGSALWTDTRYDQNGVTAGLDYRIRVVNGYLTVNLGDTTNGGTAFPSTINWDQEHWITMNIGGSTQTATPTWDGEMNPRLKLTAVPYAFQAGTAAKLVQKQASFTGTVDFETLGADRKYLLPDTTLATTASPGTVCVFNGATSNCPAATGSAFYIQNTAGSATPQTAANFNIQATNSTTNGTIGGIIRGAAGGQTVDLFQLQNTAGSVLASFSAAGALTLVPTNTSGVGLSVDLASATANGVSIDVQSNSTSQYVLNVTANNGATNALYVRADGNVGIGTAAPSSVLHVVGSNQTTAQAAAVQVLQVTGGAGGATNAGGQTGGTGSLINLTAGTGGAGQASSTAGNGGSITLQGGAPGAANTGTAGSYGNIALQVSGGNVGIGTASPSQKLQILGETNGQEVGPLLVTYSGSSNIGVALTLDGSPMSGGKSYSFLSTGASAASGAGYFAFYNGTDDFYAANLTPAGHLNVARNYYFDDAQLNVISSAAGVIGLKVKGTTGQTALLVDIENTAQAVFTVNPTGKLVSQNSTDSTEAFIVAKQDGSRSLVVDTTNNQVGIGLAVGGVPTASLSFGEGAARNINVLTRTTAAEGNSLTVQGGNGGTVTTGGAGGALILQAGNAGGTGDNNGGNVTIDAGTKTGTGTNGTVSLGVTNASAVTIGSTTSGTTTLQSAGGVKVTTLGTADTDSYTLCRDASTTQLTACDANSTGRPFLQNGNSFGGLAVLGTNDANNLQFHTGGAASSTTIRATFDQSNNLYLGNGVTAASPNAFTLQGTGSSTAGTAGTLLTIKGGAGTTATTGSAGGGLTLQGGAGGTPATTGNATVGGAVTITGGAAGGTGVATALGGAVNIQGGASFGTTTGSGVNITGGTAVGTNQNGGNVTLQGGTPTGTGAYGHLILQNTGGSVGIGTATPGANNILDIAAGNTKAVNITSDLSAAARGTYPLIISQANNATYDNTVGLINLTNADTLSTAALLNLTQVNGGNGISINNLNSNGIGINLNTINNGGIGLQFTPGANVTGINAAFSGSTGLFGNYIRFQQNTVATSTGTNSANFLNLTRSQSANSGFTLTETGDLINLASNCGGAGTCVDTSSLIKLNQQFSSSSGAVLNLLGAGTGNLAVFDGSNTTTSANGVSIDVGSSTSATYALNVTSNNGATQGLYVRADGNVGIGDASPLSLFTVGSGDMFQIDSSGDITTAAGEAFNISAGATGGAAGAITIGNTTGANTQTINLGTNATASSSTTVNIGSTIAGITTLQSAGGIKVTTLTDSTANSSTLCRDTSSTLLTSCDATNTTGKPFLNGLNDFSGTATLGTTSTGAGALQIQTSSVGRAIFAAASNNLYLGNADNTGVAAAPNAFTLQGTGSTTAGTAGALLTIKGGAGTTATTGSAGGGLTLQGGAGGTPATTGNATVGGAVSITGGAAGGLGAATAAGGNVTLSGGAGFNGGAVGTVILQSADGPVTIGSGASSGTSTIIIGATTGTGNITLGSSSGTQSVLIGNGAGISNVNIANVTTAGANVNIAGANTATGITDTINIGTGNTVGTGSKVIHIGDGTPAGTNTVTIGSIAATANTTTIQGGNGATAINIQTAASGNINIGTNAVAGKVVNIGSVSTTVQASTLHLADTTDATNAQAVTIGSAAANTGNLTILQGGSNTTQAIQLLPNTAGGILIGAGTGTGTITLGQSTATNIINIGSATVGASNTQTINIGNGAGAGTALNVSILSGVGTAGTGTLSLGNNTRVTQIDLGNIAAAAARTINVGSGSNTVGIDTLNIGTGATTVTGGKTINIGNGTPTGSGTNLITIGSIAATANTTTIQGGNGAGALSLQSAASGTIGIGTNNTANTVQVGSTTLSSGTQTIGIGNNTTAGGTTNITIGTSGSAGGATTVQAVGALTLTGGATSTWSIGGTNQNLTVQTSGTGTLALDTAGAGTVQLANANATTLSVATSNIAHAINIGTGGTSTAQAISIGSATNTTSTLALQGGTGTSTPAITLLTGATGGVAGTISIGNTTGANTQAINIGTNGTASSTTNVVIGSTIAGITTLQSAGGVKVTTLGASTSNSATLCRDTSTTFLTSCDASNTTGKPFLNGLNDFSGTATLGTTSTGGGALQIQTGSVGRAIFAAASNNLYLGNADSSGVAAAPNAFTVQGTGSSTAGTAGALLTIKGGAGTTATTGSAGGGLTLQGGAGGTPTTTGNATVGGAINITGGAASGLGAATALGGAVNITGGASFGTTTGSGVNITGGAGIGTNQNGGTVLIQGGASTGTGTTGSVTIRANTTNSTTAFLVQNAASANLLQVDTTDSNITLLGNNTGEPKAWTTTTALGTAHDNAGTVAYNGYLYMVTGDSGGALHTTVAYSKINTDGTLNTWSTTGTSMPTRDYAAVTQANGYIYVIGGTSLLANSDVRSEVYYAKINQDGTVGTFTATSALTSARKRGTAVVLNGYIYHIGGDSSSTSTAAAVDDVYYAKLNADGTVGTWALVSNATNGLPAVRYAARAVTANGLIYVLGGATNGDIAQTSVYYVRPAATGDISSAFTSEATNPLPAARFGGGVYVVNGYVYYAGGQNAGTQANVRYAPLNANGSLGAWPAANTAIDLPAGRESFAYASVNGYFYAIGGWNSSGAATTAYYTSTTRVRIGGSLDLVGIGGENLAEGGTGGNLTAGNTQVVGTLQVSDMASFLSGVNVERSLRVGDTVLFKNAVNSTTAFQVQNATTTTSIFSVDTTNSRIGINLASTETANADLSFGLGNRTINILAQTTSNTAGSTFTINSGAGNGTGAGGLLTVQSGTGGATGNGGAVVVQGGTGGATSGTGGAATLQGGTAVGAFAGGLTTIKGGTAAATAGSNGGAVAITGAVGSSTGTGGAGGNVTITAGNAAGSGANNGGNITLQAGSNTSTGTAGSITGRVMTDSAIAFQIQNAVGANLLTVDSTNTSGSLNLINNGGAETGSPPTSWAAQGAGSSVATGTGTDAASGSQSAKVTFGTSASAGTKVTFATAPTASTTVNYIVSFSAKQVSGTAITNTLQVLYSPDNGTTTATCTSTQGLSTTAWSKITCEFIPGSTTVTTALLIISQTDAPGVSRVIDIDNLSVVQQNSTGTQNVGTLRVGGPISQGLTLLTLDSYADRPFSGTSNTTLLGSMYYDTTLGRIQCYEADGWGTCGNGLDTTITLVPEYAGAVLNGTGIGTLTTDLCSGTSFRSINTSLCTASEEFSYYQWTTTQTSAQVYTIWMRYQMPSNFKNFFDDNTIKLTGRTTDTTDSFVKLSLFKADGTQCGSTTTSNPSNNNTWESPSMTGTETTCSIAANDMVTFKIELTAGLNDTVRVGNLVFKYKSL